MRIDIRSSMHSSAGPGRRHGLNLSAREMAKRKILGFPLVNQIKGSSIVYLSIVNLVIFGVGKFY